MQFDDEKLRPEILSALAKGVSQSRVILDLCYGHGYALHIAQRVFAACTALKGNNGRLAKKTSAGAVMRRIMAAKPLQC